MACLTNTSTRTAIGLRLLVVYDWGVLLGREEEDEEGEGRRGGGGGGGLEATEGSVDQLVVRVICRDSHKMNCRPGSASLNTDLVTTATAQNNRQNAKPENLWTTRLPNVHDLQK